MFKDLEPIFGKKDKKEKESSFWDIFSDDKKKKDKKDKDEELMDEELWWDEVMEDE